jgi:hypothetical protein
MHVTLRIFSRVALLLLGAVLAALSACGGDGGSDAAPPAPPAPATAAVAITGSTPANNAVDVMVDTRPTITFTATQAASVTGQATLVCGGNTIATTLSTPPATGGTLTVTPAVNLPAGSACELSVALSALPAGAGSSASAGVAFATAAAPLAAKLYVPLSYITFGGEPTGPPLVTVDLGSAQVQPVPVASNCVGTFNTAIGESQLSCQGGVDLADGTNSQFRKHSLVTGAISAGARLPFQATARTGVECADDGRCFYFFGVRGTGPSASRLAIVNGDQSPKSMVAAPDQARYPDAMRQAQGKLYILSRSHVATLADPQSFSISKFDLATERFEDFAAAGGFVAGSGVNAYAIAVAAGKVFVGVESAILAFDAVTGARLAASDLPGAAGAVDVVAAGATLYAALSNGVHAYDPVTATLQRVATGFPVSRLAVGDGKVYAFSASQVRELDPLSLATVRTFQLPAGGAVNLQPWVAQPR